MWIVWVEGPNSRDSSLSIRSGRTKSNIYCPKPGGYGGFEFGIVDISYAENPLSTKTRQHKTCLWERLRCQSNNSG